MTINIQAITHGPTEVAGAALAEGPVSIEVLQAALINAFSHIAALERRLAAVEGIARKAANDASCLANGITPD